MKIATTALAALTLGAPALAGNFSGPRIEADLGWDKPKAQVEVSSIPFHTRDNGLVFGGEAGYDLRFGPAVVGALVGIDGSTSKGCDGVSLTDCVKQGRDLAVGARAGIVVAPRVLLYAKGEYVNVKLKNLFFASNGPTFPSNRTNSGYRLGAGAEFALTPHLYIKGEYRYSAYRRVPLDNVGVTQVNARLTRNQIVGGIGFRF